MTKTKNLVPRSTLLDIRVCDRYKFKDKAFYYKLKTQLLQQKGDYQGYALQHLYKYQVGGKRKTKTVTSVMSPDEISNAGIGGYSFMSEHRHLLHRVILQTRHSHKHVPEYHVVHDLSPEYKYRFHTLVHMSDGYNDAIKDIREFGVPKMPNGFSKIFSPKTRFLQFMWYCYNTLNLPDEIIKEIESYSFIEEQNKYQSILLEACRDSQKSNQGHALPVVSLNFNYD